MNGLYNIIIYPIELIVEVVFSTINGLFRNPGIAIMGVSLIVSVLVLPLYAKADAIQEEERKKQQAMSHWTEHIRKTFKGDERFMMLSVYYRKQDYRPVYSLRSSISLLLQVPFFIAAYHFLSHLDLLNGTSFLLIRDLGQPDQILKLGPVSVNILPILMTLINYCSCAIYTKGFPLKDKLQPYLLALFFLVFLYGSPSGLVLYWTMNNLFSLLKNIFIKLFKISERRDAKPKAESKAPESGRDRLIFLLGAVILTILTGLLIPSSVISASPEEFINLNDYRDPLYYVFNTFCIAAGYFLFWLSVLYYLSSSGVRKVLRCFLWLCCGCALVDFFLFGRELGNLSSMLIFDKVPAYSMQEKGINILAVSVVCLILLLIWKKLRGLVVRIYIPVMISLLAVSMVNFATAERILKEASYLWSGREDSSQEMPILLDRSGKNVVVIMLDRGISGYIPFILTERPELKDQLKGFVYYPNTISFGTATNFGSPALFGGYEYSVSEINKRPEESLVSKHNEALRVMPVLFSSAGFQTTVCDPPWVNYRYITDFSIYEDHPEIRTFAVSDTVGKMGDSVDYSVQEKGRKRAFFMYSVFKTVPVIFQNEVYNGGDYRAAEVPSFFSEQKFMEAYTSLKEFPALTAVKDSGQNTFLMITNNTTHEPCELQLPEYEPAADMDNEGLESGYRQDGEGNRIEIDEQYHYHANMAALIQIGKWLDHLRENGVYDNTRIVIVADHGDGLGQFEDLILEDGTDLQWVNPLLLYKDFNSENEFELSDEFMTNADTPTLALRGLIDEPVNPFTGKIIDNKEKTAHEQLVTMSQNWDVLTNNGNTFDTSDADWYSISDNIFRKENWKRLPSLR